MTLQLVVPVGFGGQRGLHLLLIQAVQAAFGLQGEDDNLNFHTARHKLTIVSIEFKFKTIILAAEANIGQIILKTND